MSIWSSTSSTSFNPVNYGVTANDGSGDNLRQAFIKVDTNFGNVSQWLSGTFPEFLNANVDGTVQAQWANVTAANIGTISNSAGGSLNIGSALIPNLDGTYDLGSPTLQFRNIYLSGGTVSHGASQTTEAGLFLVHLHSNIGDIQDVGIQGNITNSYSSNTYAFFGHQYTTNNFIYKITPTDATKGNNVVIGGVYGNAQLGSLFLSNVTTATGTNTNSGVLIVGGDVGVGGRSQPAIQINLRSGWHRASHN